MVKDFREFVARGNVVDMAVGIIMGSAFGVIVKSLVSDLIMPPVGLVLGNVDFSNLFVVLKTGAPDAPYRSLADAQAAGAVTLNYGVFVSTVLSFLVVAFAVFLLVRQINRLQRERAATSRDCPYCLSSIPLNATRCAHCTSEIAA